MLRRSGLGTGLAGHTRRCALGKVRTAAKAVIVRNEEILLNHCRAGTVEYYALPGGGQEEGETLEETLQRECEEEIGTRVDVQRLLYVREIVVAHHSFTYLEEAAHQVEHLFECQVPDDYEPHCGSGSDAQQIAVVWMGAEALAKVRVNPSTLRDLMDPARRDQLPMYWGDVE